MAYECKLIECYPGFGPELTTDGNMEDDPATNWPAGGGAAVAASTVQEHGGCQSLRVTDGGAGGGYASQSVTVEAGERYKIETWGYSTAAGDTWRVRIYVGANPVWMGDTHDVTAPVAWEKDIKFYRVPDGVTTIIIRLEVIGAAKVLYFDDVSVRREAPVPMTEIDLQYHASGTAGFSLLNRGVVVGRPERVSLYGGRLQLELVRQDDGKRTIPLRLVIKGDDGEDLIDRVNALEEMLRHAARYRKDGWGGEVFLELKIDDATDSNWFPVHEGEIDTAGLYEKCGGEQDDMIKELPLWVTCEPYWEADVTYDLSNFLDNPGFEEWNAGICDSQPDCWTDYETAGAAGRNDQETDIVEEGCEALQIELIAAAAGLYQGVTQNIGARVRADTEYTLLAWVQNEAIVNGSVYIFVEGAAAAVRGTAINDGVARSDYTLVSCQFTPLAADIAANVHIRVRLEAVGGACTAVAHIDKMLVMEASNVPTGWMSSSYLTNHYDRDANTINFLSVSDIPGEVEAEAKISMDLTEPIYTIWNARRTRDDPCNFIWQLIPCEGYTTAEGGGAACVPGLTHASCIDSDKIVDPNSPSGSRIQVSFAGVQTMQLRCFWNVTNNLPNYYGKYQLVLLVSKSADTDDVLMRVQAYNPGLSHNQGYIYEHEAQQAAANYWSVLPGWSILSFPIGTHDDNLWGAGNRWQIRLYASVTGAAAWDNLWIAGAYLSPLDEGSMVAGTANTQYPAGTDISLNCLNTKKGVFPYDPTFDIYYNNVGYVGQLPQLTPKVENWLYFILGQTFGTGEVLITDPAVVSVTYRPRGIFLRGTNP